MMQHNVAKGGSRAAATSKMAGTYGDFIINFQHITSYSRLFTVAFEHTIVCWGWTIILYDSV